MTAAELTLLSHYHRLGHLHSVLGPPDISVQMNPCMDENKTFKQSKKSMFIMFLLVKKLLGIVLGIFGDNDKTLNFYFILFP